jgi:hypothetical protein
LSCVEGETDVVEGWGNKTARTARGDSPSSILVYEGLFEKERCKENSNRRDKKAKLRAFGGASAFMID